MSAAAVLRTLPLRLGTNNGRITQSGYPTGDHPRDSAQAKTAGPVRHHPSMANPRTKAAKPPRRGVRSPRRTSAAAPVHRKAEPCRRPPWRRRAASRARHCRPPTRARRPCRRRARPAARSAAARGRRRRGGRPSATSATPTPPACEIEPSNGGGNSGRDRSISTGPSCAPSARRAASRPSRKSRRREALIARASRASSGCGAETPQLARVGDAQREPEISRRREIHLGTRHGLHCRPRAPRDREFQSPDGPRLWSSADARSDRSGHAKRRTDCHRHSHPSGPSAPRIICPATGCSTGSSSRPRIAGCTSPTRTAGGTSGTTRGSPGSWPRPPSGSRRSGPVTRDRSRSRSPPARSSWPRSSAAWSPATPRAR